MLDRGFFSAENLERMRDRRTEFIIGLPAMTALFEALIEKTVPRIQTPSNAFMFNGTPHFGVVERVRVGGIPLYAYVMLNPERKAREEKKLSSEILERAAYLRGRRRK